MQNIHGWLDQVNINGDDIEENTIWQGFIKANYATFLSNVISNQDIDQSASILDQAMDDAVNILQEIWLNHSFSAP